MKAGCLKRLSGEAVFFIENQISLEFHSWGFGTGDSQTGVMCKHQAVSACFNARTRPCIWTLLPAHRIDDNFWKNRQLCEEAAESLGQILAALKKAGAAQNASTEVEGLCTQLAALQQVMLTTEKDVLDVQTHNTEAAAAQIKKLLPQVRDVVGVGTGPWEHWLEAPGIDLELLLGMPLLLG